VKKTGLYFKEKEILLSELIWQLQKDLRMSGINADLLQDVSREEDLIRRLMEIIENLLMYKPGLFHNLLYRIDIKEENLQILGRENLQWELAKMIIKREIIKVYYRKKFG